MGELEDVKAELAKLKEAEGLGKISGDVPVQKPEPKKELSPKEYAQEILKGRVPGVE